MSLSGVFADATPIAETVIIPTMVLIILITTGCLITRDVQVLKSLESCLHHYNTCMQLYNPSRYPRRWGLAALEMGMALGAMADLVERVSTHVKLFSQGMCFMYMVQCFQKFFSGNLERQTYRNRYEVDHIHEAVIMVDPRNATTHPEIAVWKPQSGY